MPKIYVEVAIVLVPRQQQPKAHKPEAKNTTREGMDVGYLLKLEAKTK